MNPFFRRRAAAVLAAALSIPAAPVFALTRAGEPAVPPPLPRGEVILPSGRLLLVEVADTPTLRENGYMFREKIGDNEGMVFIMPEPGFHSFWMKNCKVPLDILWLDEQWNVVHREHALPPCREAVCPNYTPLRLSRFVLEVRAGLAREEGIRLGDHIQFKSLDPKTPLP